MIRPKELMLINAPQYVATGQLPPFMTGSRFQKILEIFVAVVIANELR